MPIKQFIAAAVSDPGTPIDAYHRAVMEDCFQTSFHDVRLHFSPAADAANRALHSLALTTGSHICFHSSVNVCAGSNFTRLLAHELAHVVQKRCRPVTHLRYPGNVNGHQLEYEACLAANSVLNRSPLPHLSPDPTTLPRTYGLAGHYYTAFYTAMAAGFDFAVANDIAFFTQLADLVTELDGKEAGIRWYMWSVTFEHPTPFTDELEIASTEMRKCLQIEVGLHSLSGGSSSAETQYRTEIANRYNPGTLAFGLAVHAFGDSFAHRVVDHEDTMYAAPLGHGIEGVNAFFRGEEAPAESPDWIYRRPDLYINYGTQLYNLFISKQANNPSAKDARVSIASFQADLREVTKISSEGSQIDLLVSKTTSLSTSATTIYRPSGEKLPWEVFRLQREHLHHDPGNLVKSLEFAAAWAGSVENISISLHADAGFIDHFINSNLYLPKQELP